MPDKIRGSSETPRYLVERAADAGIQAIGEYLAHHDAKVEKLFICLDVDTTPGDEPDSVTCGSGLEDPKDVVALCVMHAAAAGRQIGLKIGVMPVTTRPEG